MARSTSEFHIRPAHLHEAVAVIVLNIVLTAMVLGAVLVSGEFNPPTNALDLLFECASALAAFLLFAAMAMVRVTVTSHTALLLGLYLWQMGRLLDVTDEVITVDSIYWSVAGDALALAGEVTLAVIAFSFVRLSNNIVNRDGLTGLYNRTHHLRRLKDLLKDARQQQSSVAVIAIDIDRFKQVNDTFGHAYGDEVLRHVGRLLLRALQPGEIVSRTGGEEFEVLIPEADEAMALSRAETLRKLLADNPAERLESLTASIGVALGNNPRDINNLRKRADEAAYDAKQRGRNQVHLGED